MRVSEVLLVNLLMSINEKADKLISLLKVSKDTENSGDDSASTCDNSPDSFQD